MQTQIKKAVFPAGGLGTRFLPATKALPKEMLPIVDKPLIQYAVEEAQFCGIEDMIIITGKYKRAIEDHFDCAYELEETLKKTGKEKLLNDINKLNNINLCYIRQRNPLGLGHAILCAKPFIKDEPFAVLLSDDVIDPDDKLLEDMIKIHEKYHCSVVALEQVPMSEVHKYGVIDGKSSGGNIYSINDLVEKPEKEKAPSDLAIIGRYILTPEIFQELENIQPGRGGEIQLTDALRKLVKKQNIYGCLFKGRRFDAGDKLGSLKATVSFALKNPELSDAFKKYLLSVTSTFTNQSSGNKNS